MTSQAIWLKYLFGWTTWFPFVLLCHIRPKKKRCLIGVTRPTLVTLPTLDIFINFSTKKSINKKKIQPTYLQKKIMLLPSNHFFKGLMVCRLGLYFYSNLNICNGYMNTGQLWPTFDTFTRHNLDGPPK